MLNIVTQDFGSKQGRFAARCLASQQKSNAVLARKTSENTVTYFGRVPYNYKNKFYTYKQGRKGKVYFLNILRQHNLRLTAQKSFTNECQFIAYNSELIVFLSQINDYKNNRI